MKVAIYSTRSYEEPFLEASNRERGHELRLLEARLTADTVALAEGCDAVCAFVSDDLDATTVHGLADLGVRFIALRSAGFNHVDLEAAKERGLPVVRVPAYSPYAVAEHAAALMLCLNRQVHRAWNRVREGNFGLNGLLGFDLHGKTAGIVGTGKIGICTARILQGFGCRIQGMDTYPNDAFREIGTYVDAETIWRESDVISLHCPLTPETFHLINVEVIGQMKKGVMLVNTSRGALVDTAAAIEGLKAGKIGSLGLDVYEEEEELFFRDLSNQGIPDDQLARLIAFPNVVVTGHQAFFTREALTNIIETTLQNLSDLERDGTSPNTVGD